MIEVLSVAEVGERLGCSRRRVFDLLKDGTLERAPRYGREIRIYAASVDRALAPKKAQRKRAIRAGRVWSKADLDPRLLA